MRNKIVLFVLLCVLGLAACGPAGEGATPSLESNNPPVVSNGEFQLDPANVDKSAYPLVENLYEGLVKEADGEIKGQLAESYSMSDDGLDYIFYLRPGVTFHNGETLNADAVIANFHRWFDKNDPNRGNGAYQVWVDSFGGFKGDVTDTNVAKSVYDGIEKVNDLTVLIHLNKEDAEFLKKLTSPAFSIVHPAVLQAGNTADGGTGPYKFNSVTSSGTVKLDPFESYWDASSIPSQSIEVSAQ